MIDTETPKRKNTPRRLHRGWFVLVGVGLVLVVVGIFGFSRLVENNTNLYCLDTLFPSGVDVEQHAFFEQPPSAHNFEYRVERSEDTTCTIWVSFEMDPADFQRLQASVLVGTLKPDIMIHSRFYSLMEQQGWKIPESFLASYRAAATETHYVVMQLVLVDIADLAQTKVYIITFIPCARSEPDCSIPL